MNQKKDIHLIGAAHLDVVWFWPFTEGLSEVKSTFQAALDRLKEFPDFIFTCSSAAYYEWLDEAFPDIFAEIQKYVAEGRWVIVNGWYVQPDVNIPCGESLARHGLYSQRYYLEKLGKICDVGYNMDSFGHSPMLPQILSKSGMRGYFFSRPRPSENADIPDIFNWVSSDGSRVIGVRTTQYAGPGVLGVNHPELLESRIQTQRERGSGDELPRTYFYGVGNHGGGPTIALLKELERLQKNDPHLLYSSPNAFLQAVEGKPLPTWDTELQVHAIGCYSAYLHVKQLNRRAEISLLQAETLGALAHMTLGQKQQTARLRDGWKRVLFNHFHDLICGCSSQQVYRDADASFGYAQQIANEQSNRALQQMTWNIDTLGADELPNSKDEGFWLWGFTGKGAPLIVYNPLPFPVRQPVLANGIHDCITDHNGKPVLVQKIRNNVTSVDWGGAHQYSTIFDAELPAMGYATFWLHKQPHDNVTDEHLLCREDLLENDFLKVEFDRVFGGIRQITRKDTGKAYLKATGSVGVVIDETESDTWGHRLFSYRNEVGRFRLQKTEVLEEGPLRARLRMTSVWGDSILRQDFILDRDAKHLDVRLYIQWREHHKMLKLEFPVNTNADSYTAEIPYGVIERKADGTEKPMQRWLDLDAFAVVNDSNYAADVQDGTIRMTVLRSPKFTDHNAAYDENGQRDPYGEFMEQGEHSVGFRLVPHDGDWRAAEIYRHAAIFNTEIYPIYETYHHGKLPPMAAGIRVDDPAVMPVMIKEAEDGGAYILRCQETHGKDLHTTLSLPLIGRTWEADFSHYEIKTFRIPYDKTQPVTETDLLER